MRKAGAWIAGAAALVAGGAAAARRGALAAERRREQANIDLVLAMWDGVINRADDEAVMRYVAPDYRQHNPNVAQGRAGVLELTSLIRNTPPGLVPPGKKTLLHAVAQDDYVVVIWNQPQPDPNEPGAFYQGQAFDMFRIENGQVVEHWDDTRKAPRPWRRDAYKDASEG